MEKYDLIQHGRNVGVVIDLGEDNAPHQQYGVVVLGFDWVSADLISDEGKGFLVRDINESTDDIIIQANNYYGIKTTVDFCKKIIEHYTDENGELKVQPRSKTIKEAI